MKTPVNARTLKNHFTYSWWKYLLVLLAGIFLVNLIFTVTAPRIPEDKKVEFYICGLADEQKLTSYLENVRLSEMPDMESLTYVTLYQEETYGVMQLMTHMAAHEGDIYLMRRDDFLSYAANGVFKPLEDDEELMSFFADAGVDLRRGWRTLSESDETHLYGIPADVLPGLSYMCYADNGYLAVLDFNGNDENSMKFLRILCRDMITAPEPAETESTDAAPQNAAP